MTQDVRSASSRPSARKRWGFVFCLLFALICLVPSFAFAQEEEGGSRSWRISRFHDNIGVMDDGTMVVTEQISLVFVGSFRGIHRRIPVNYPGPRGTNYTLYIDDIKVRDAAGSPLKFESRRKGDYRVLTIYIPGATDTEKQVQISYTVRNGIRYFEDHDELYWNVTGNDWPVPIDSASAFVSFPSDGNGRLRAQAFTGVYGSYDQEATAEVKGSAATFETTNPLPMRGGLTINVYLPKGTVGQPSSLRRAWWFLGSNLIVLLPVFTLAVMFGMWYVKGRDPDAGLSVAPMYEPPKGMSPAEIGSLIDDSVDPRDITSTLVDLAVRGYLRIEEKNEKVLFFNNRDFVFHLLKPQDQWSDLAAHERQILSNMFSYGDQSTTLSSLKNRFYTAIPGVKRAILEELKRKEVYRVDPDSANMYRVLAMLIIAAPFLVAQVTGVYQFFNAPLVFVIALAVSLLIVWLFGRIMTAKTLKGARAEVSVLGFREFMMRVDADRLRRFPPDTFEKYLPFAMALGVERHWAQAFQGIIQNPPNWYTGSTYPGMWNPIYFTNSMNTMSNSAYEAFTAAPRASSSGSGFRGGGFSSGGGFSGGGFGGGGGSAF